MHKLYLSRALRNLEAHRLRRIGFTVSIYSKIGADVNMALDKEFWPPSVKPQQVLYGLHTTHPDNEGENNDALGHFPLGTCACQNATS
jgi:hypothetical protein